MNLSDFSITAILLVLAFFTLNLAFAQNETAPTIWFDNASYATKEMSCYSYETGKILGQEQKIATITVTDQAANKYSASIDRVIVYVWSDSDRKGIQITAYETDVNSGIFKGTVTITEGQSTQNLIHVRDGDTITAKYAGTTPWSPNATNHGITTTAFIGTTCPPLERVPSSEIQITDNQGNEQKPILVDKQIQIGSNLTNVTIRNQTFAYIVQILNKDNSAESLSWVSGLLLPSQTFSPSVSWIPPRAGNYTVNVFVWQSINNPNSLSPPVLSDLTVWPSLSDYTRSSIRNGENFECQSGYELVIKSNHSTACVTPQTAQKLVERGWKYYVSSTNTSGMDLGNVCGQFYAAPNDQHNPRATPVLLMNSNSTACVRLTFTVVSNYKDCNGQTCQNIIALGSTLHIGDLHYEKHNNMFSVSASKDYTNSFNITTIPGAIDLENYPVGANFTVIYVIKPLTNATGFYDQSIPKLACEAYLLAVGYTADQVNASDFNYIDRLNPPCAAGVYTLGGVEIAGMNYTEVALPQ